MHVISVCDVHCAEREPVSAVLCQQPQPQTWRRSNQRRMKLLIIHTWVCQLHQRGSLQIPSPLAKNYWIQGKDKFVWNMQGNLWISERERERERSCVFALLDTCTFVCVCACVPVVRMCIIVFAALCKFICRWSLPPIPHPRTLQLPSWQWEVMKWVTVSEWEAIYRLSSRFSMLSQSWTGTAPLIFVQVAALARSPAPVARVPVAIIWCALLCRCVRIAVSGSKKALCSQMCLLGRPGTY